MKVVRVFPQGYCHGVVRALNIVIKAAKNPNILRPIYILGDIVHNKFITDYLTRCGIISLNLKGKTRLELLDYIDSGTVIFTAHGVSDQVREKARIKKLNIIDAVCVDVKKTHSLVKEKIELGYYILYIGKKNHPETEGIVNINKERVLLIEREEDIHKYLHINGNEILITNQTTLSLWDVAKISNSIKKVFTNANFISEICNATQLRQEAIVTYSQLVDIFIIVGDKMSNNTNRLLQIAKQQGKSAYRVSSVMDVQPKWFINKNNVAVTSGASTPIKITLQVIDYLEKFIYDDISTWSKDKYFNENDVIPQLKDIVK